MRHSSSVVSFSPSAAGVVGRATNTPEPHTDALNGGNAASTHQQDTLFVKSPSLYRKSRRTHRLINEQPSETPLPTPILSPFVRLGLYRLLTGRNPMLSATSGAQLNRELDSLDAQGIPYPENPFRL